MPSALVKVGLSLSGLVAVFATADAFCQAPPPGAPQVAVSQSGSLNLGHTSFMDGFGSSEAGFVYQSFLRGTRARSLRDGSGNPGLVPANPHVEVYAWAHQLIYTSPIAVGSGLLGFTSVVPLLQTHASSDPLPPPGSRLSDNGGGVGDIVVGTFVQFMPAGGRTGPPIAQRLELDFILPTGKYDPHRDVQPGSNFFALNPYYAITILPARGWEVSTRLQYVHNFRNDHPSNAPPAIFNTRAGNAAFANFAASYEAAPDLRVGINGYYLRQLSDNRVNDVEQNASRARKLGLGPGLLWSYSKTDRFFANYYVERAVRNAPKASVAQVRWVHMFE